jgi:hypothetical protein
LKKTTLPGNFTRNKKKTNYKEKKKENSKFCILTLLYLENDKSHKKSVSILYKDQRFPGACNRSPGSKLLSITTQLHCGSHLGGRARLPYTILEEDHPMTIP